MSAATLIRRSLGFYWRTHIGVVLGAALGAMVLTGSLLVGDSVKATLRRQAELRVGRVDFAFVGGERLFRASLADAIQSPGRIPLAPLLMLRASVARADGSARVNVAQLLGVDERFWKLSPSRAAVELPPGTIAINERTARQLGVVVGDTVIVRLEKPSAFSRDAPLSGEENALIAVRVKIARVVGDQEFGRFAFNASQVPPFSVFAPLADVQGKIGETGKANVILLEAKDRAETFRDSVTAQFSLEDAALELRPLEKSAGVELRTSRVFLDHPVIEAAPRGIDVLTYLVNELRVGEKSTPYSMVTAIDAAACGFLPAELADDEIVLNQWLADDLGAKSGDRVTLKYFVMGERRELTEKSREFTVLSILPLDEPQLDGSWMPDFPGLTDKKSCREWEPGFEMDVSKFRDKDEAYWDKYRGTPKAFVNIAMGQQMWANRWGELTAIRYRAPADAKAIASQILAKLTPEQAGMSFIPLRQQALGATDAPVDFGQLFVSFSFFLIVAAAVLTGLLFVFSIEQRRAEAGLLLGLGWRPWQVRRVFLFEGAALSVIGSVAGVAAALIYTRLVLRALATIWRGAVGTTDFVFAPGMMTLAIGVISGMLIALLAMWFASRRLFRHSARELLGGTSAEFADARGWRKKKRSEVAARKISETDASVSSSERQPSSANSAVSKIPGLPLIGGVVGILGALALAFTASGAEAFFGAGSLLLIGGCLLALARLRCAAVADGSLKSIAQLGARNAARRRGRSLATIAVLASGVFIVVAVDSFRQRPQGATMERDSGTGGFALVGESALPIYDDLNSDKGRESFALDEKTMAGVSVMPMRVLAGDDASCLNLNRALHPRLLGVKPGDLQSRFHFSDAKSGWEQLDDDTKGDNAIPGIVDQATLQWALQKKLGDTLTYQDERGQPFEVRLVATLAGSILQGDVVISEKHFIEKFPGHGGYRFFLVDAPNVEGANGSEAVARELSRALQDRGFAVTLAWRRLAEFQAVENTYLSIFQVLGGLGLLLGSAGLAIVVGRNVLERRSEFGLLEAVGFRPRQLRRLVFAEHRWLIICGLVIGVGSALLAVWPGLRERAGGFPLAEMSLLVAALAAGCVFWVWLATRLALRGSRIAALRSE